MLNWRGNELPRTANCGVSKTARNEASFGEYDPERFKRPACNGRDEGGEKHRFSGLRRPLSLHNISYKTSSSFLHVFRNALLIAILTNRVDEIPFRPELPTPKGLLYRRHTHEDLSGSYALDRLNNLPRAIHRNSLNQKMNMIHIRPYLQKPYLVTLRYLQAYVPQLLIHLFRKHHAPILRWTYQMIQ